jgi:hypothetical protein
VGVGQLDAAGPAARARCWRGSLSVGGFLGLLLLLLLQLLLTAFVAGFLCGLVLGIVLMKRTLR